MWSSWRRIALRAIRRGRASVLAQPIHWHKPLERTYFIPIGAIMCKKIIRWTLWPMPDLFTHCPWCGAPIGESLDIECDLKGLERMCVDAEPNASWASRASGIPDDLMREYGYRRLTIDESSPCRREIYALVLLIP